MTVPLDCSQARARMSEYLDRELDLKTIRSVLDHLEGCRECFSQYEVYEILKRVIHQCGQKISAQAGFVEKTRAFLNAHS